MTTMNRINREQIYNAAWKHWGADTQMDKCIEEMAELIQAILKARHSGVTFSYSVSEELADVIICLEQLEAQMRVIPHNLTKYQKDNHKNIWVNQVMVMKEQKLQRLKEHLLESMGKRHGLVEEKYTTQKVKT